MIAIFRGGPVISMTQIIRLREVGSDQTLRSLIQISKSNAAWYTTTKIGPSKSAGDAEFKVAGIHVLGAGGHT